MAEKKAPAKKAEPVKKATATTKKAEPTKATATTKKAEPVKKATATAKKAEPAKTTATAKKAEPAKTTATAKKAEPAKTTATAKKAEPAKTKAFADRKAKTPTSEVGATLVADTKPKKVMAKVDVKPKKATGGAGEATIAEPNLKKIILIVVSVLLVFLTILILVLSLRACGANKTPYVNAYKNVTQVGMSSEVIGKVDRFKPVEGVTDGGLVNNGTISNYPKWGYTTSYTEAQKNAILAENRSLCGRLTTNTGGVYTYMDENGYIFDGTRSDPLPLYDASGKQRQLYQHTGSVGLYMGNVSDDEQAVVKSFTFRKRSYSSYYDATGLYAPAGELIKIQLTDEDMTNTGGIIIHIGQALYNGQCNNIWSARNFNRMPIILNTMAVTKDTAEYDEETGLWTAYVGSFVGGPIYVRDENCIFNVTISGGVNYAHFILGVTTEDEYNEYAKSSAPYFDLEVWDSGVLHSGPMAYAKNFSYDELYKAAVLWEKISLVSSRVVNQGVVFIYDCFVAAGAAVAFPGRRSVNCPGGWMTSSLNYASIVASGSWGNFHEYHHNFQTYGVGYTGEVTNNGLNLVSYSLFTKISSARGVSNYGAAGLSGWNTYTCATWALARVNAGQISSTNGLAVYSTMLHNFGQDAYITCTGANGTNWFTKWSNYTHQDFSYFASMITPYTGSLVATTSNDYPLFVPVSSVYQTGRRYYVDGVDKEFQSMQPYVIPYGEDFTVDLRPYTEDGGQYQYGSIIIGKDFSYKIKSVKTDKGFNGTLTKTDEEDVYTFKPNKEMLSGKIYVTLEITQNANSTFSTSKTVDDVELVLQFEQSHESKKMTLERTTYEYGADAGYTDAVEAYNKNFAGYSDMVNRDHANPTQNANTDIWYIPPSNLTKFPNALDWQTIDATTNKIDVIDGKLYFAEDGIYRIYLRGRVNCALYYSMDGKNYALGATVKSGRNSSFYTTDPETYFDVQFVTKEDGSSYTMTVYQDYSSSKTGTSMELTGDRWLYIKEVLITKMYGGTASYIGVGTA
ncbi:MAG: M60 family metallopeptidase, partial [Clostridia bacterium]|nr:M60 family metallopeptidase [Clostridia bacterium]